MLHFYVFSNGATNEAEAAKPLNTTVGKSPGKVAAKKRTADDMSPVSEAPSSKKGRRSISTLSQVLHMQFVKKIRQSISKNL